MGGRARRRARRRGAARCARARGAGPARRGARVLTLLIREGPATELTVATRILAHLGLLAGDGRVALVVGSEVVYLAGRGMPAATMTPYDIGAVRLGDGLDLTGTAPDDAGTYLAALRADRHAGVVARAADGAMVTAAGVVALVERLSGLAWGEAEARARAAGGLVGAYPAEG